MNWDTLYVLAQDLVIEPQGQGDFQVKLKSNPIYSTELDTNATSVLLSFSKPQKVALAFDNFGARFDVDREQFDQYLSEMASNGLIVPHGNMDSPDFQTPAMPPDTGKLLFRAIQGALEQGKEEEFKLHIEAGRIQIGTRTYGWHWVEFDFYSVADHRSRVIIGNYCSLARGVTFVVGGVHPTNWVSTYFSGLFGQVNMPELEELPPPPGDIVVGSDVWIARDAMLLSGVTVGDGAVITARSVVTKDVPSYAIVGGSPARVIRYRFPPEVIEALLRICWWEWDHSKVEEAIPLLNSSRIEEFIIKYK